MGWNADRVRNNLYLDFGHSKVNYTLVNITINLFRGKNYDLEKITSVNTHCYKRERNLFISSGKPQKLITGFTEKPSRFFFGRLSIVLVLCREGFFLRWVERRAPCVSGCILFIKTLKAFSVYTFLSSFLSKEIKHMRDLGGRLNLADIIFPPT